MISIVIALNALFNTLLIAVFVKYPQLREDRLNLFMLSLTVSDLVIGVTSMPISAAYCSGVNAQESPANRVLLVIQYIFLNWCCIVSLHSLCWVTMCKMIAIIAPLRYEQLLSKARCYAIIASTWIIGGALSLGSSGFNVKWDVVLCLSQCSYESRIYSSITTIYTVLLSIALIGIVCATSRILCAVVRTHIKIRTQVHSIGGQSNAVEGIASLTLRTLRSGLTLLIMCGGVLSLTIPYMVYIFRTLIPGKHSMSPSYRFVACWISLCNSFVNSLLYLVLFRTVRRKASEILQRMIDYW